MSGGDSGQSFADADACDHPAQDVIANTLNSHLGWCAACGDAVRRASTRRAPGLGSIVEWVLVNPAEGRTGTGEGSGTMLPPAPPPRAS